MTKIRANQTEIEEILNDPSAGATTTKKGSVEIATQAEVDAGIDTERSITPLTLKGFTGTFEPADATILKDADIGVTVQGYDATILVDADIGVNVEQFITKNSAFNLDFGTTTGTVSQGDHTHALDDLTDVVIGGSPLLTGHTLTFDGANWINQTPASGITDHILLSNIGSNSHVQIDAHIVDATIHFSTLNGLSDVVVAGSPLVTNQVLTFNGTNWVNAPAVSGASVLDDLTDVVLGSPVTDQVLKYNGTNWVNSVNLGAFTLTANNTLYAGTDAGASLTTGTGHFLAGLNAGTLITTGFANIAIGEDALSSAASGVNDSIAIGRKALRDVTVSNNIAIGGSAGYRMSGTSSRNIILGTLSGIGLYGTGNLDNIILGVSAGGEVGNSVTSATDNIAMGRFALRVLAGGFRNIAIGKNSGSTITSGYKNVIIGAYANGGTTGKNNVSLGEHAAAGLTTGDHNVSIGVYSGYSTNQSNKLSIHSSGATTNTPLIGGDFSAGTVIINGTLTVTGGVDALTSATTVINVSSADAPTAGQVLTATNGTAATWETPTGGSGGSPVITVLNDLADVIIGGSPLVTGNTLTYDGSSWINQTPASGITDHTLLSNIGTNTHAQIDTHIATGSPIHFLQSEISITKSQLSDFNEGDYATGAEGDLATSALQDITAEPIGDLSDVVIGGSPLLTGHTLTYDGANWINQTPASGITDHTLLSNIGSNTHAQIDAHIIDTTIHFSTLAGLSDVIVAGSPAVTNQVLTFDGTNWVNADIPPAASVALNDLTDVVIGGSPLLTGHTLTYDGVNWINQTPASGITDHTLLSNIGTNTHTQIDTHISAYTAHNNWMIADNNTDFAIAPTATAGNSVTIGNNSTNAGGSSFLVGPSASNASASSFAVTIGAYAKSTQTSTVAIGVTSHAYGPSATAVGRKAYAIGAQSVSIGNESQATTIHGVAVGAYSVASLVSQVSIGDSVVSSSVSSDVAYSVKLGYGVTGTNKNLLHLYSKGKLELYGDEAQFVFPSYVVTGSPIDVPANSVEGGVIYDSVAKGLEIYDGTSWSAIVGGSSVALNDLTDVVIGGSPLLTGHTLTYDGANWINQTPASGITDHTLLSNIGTNTHTQIDTHIIDTTIHFSTLNGLSDVVVAGSPAVTNQVLTFDGTNWVNSTPGVVNNWITGNNGSDFNISPTAAGVHALAAGRNASAGGTRSISFGYNTQANVTDAIAIGTNAKATNSGGISIGDSSDSADGASVALGTDAQATGLNTIALGYKAQALEAQTVVIGQRATDRASSGTGKNVLIGSYASTVAGSASNNVAVGTSAGIKLSTAVFCTVVGDSSQADLTYQTVIGANLSSADVTTDVSYSLKVGINNFADTELSLIHLHTKGHFELYGDESQIVFPNYIVTGSPVGVPATADEGAVIYDSTAKGLQLYDGASWSAIGSGGGSVALNDLTDVVVAGSPAVNGQVLTFDGSNWINAVTTGEANKNWIVANAGVDFTLVPTSSGTRTIAIGSSADASGTRSLAIGDNATAGAFDTIAIGSNSIATTNWGIAVGYGANAGNNSVSIGRTTATPNGSSIAIGWGAKANLFKSMAIGIGAVADAIGGISIGNHGSDVFLNATYSIAMGKLVKAEETHQTVVGANLEAADVTTNVAYSVKLGYGGTTHKNILHLFSKGKLELYGDEAQYIFPSYVVTGSPIDVPANSVEGGVIYDSVAKGLELYDGTSWSAVGGSSVALNDLTDVTLGSPVTNEVLTFDGSNWVNAGTTGEANKNWLVADNGDDFLNPPVSTGTNGIALGNNASSGAASNAIAIGTNADTAGGTGGIAIGVNADINNGNTCIVIGSGAKLTAYTNNSAIIIGDRAAGTTALGGIALGYKALCYANVAVCIGRQAATRSARDVVIGPYTTTGVSATIGRNVVIGTNSSSTTTAHAVAIGDAAKADLDYQVVMGYRVDGTKIPTTGVTHSVKLGSAATTNLNILHLYSKGKLELHGDEAQYIFPSYATGSPATYPANSVEGGVIYDSVAKGLELYDGTSWSAVGGGGAASTKPTYEAIVIAGSPVSAVVTTTVSTVALTGNPLLAGLLVFRNGAQQSEGVMAGSPLQPSEDFAVTGANELTFGTGVLEVGNKINIYVFE